MDGFDVHAEGQDALGPRAIASRAEVAPRGGSRLVIRAGDGVGVQGIFAGAEAVYVALPSEGAPHYALAATTELLTREATELALELGAPVCLEAGASDARPRLELRVDPALAVPTLTLDREAGVLIAGGADLDGAVEALSLLRTLRCTGQLHHEARPAVSVDEAIERLEREVAWTYPAFGLRGIDWPQLCTQFRGRVDPVDPLPGLQRWIARLGDAHTRVRATDPVGQLAYTARVVDRAVRFMHVPADSPAAQAGVRTGDALLDVDVQELWARTGAPEHLRPWLVGRLALAGPHGEPRSYRVQRADGTATTFSDTPGTASHEPPVSAVARDHGTGYLKIDSWQPGTADQIDDALHQLRACDRLLVDLRGNVGGSLVEAASFRDRFIDRPTTLGTIRFSTGDGQLSPPAPIRGHPAERTRWHKRTRFLTDALTYSASEDAILGLRQLDHIDTAGARSGGGSGRARTIRLLDSIDLHVSTAMTYDHDGQCIEGAGIRVDVPLDLPPEPAAWNIADHHW